MLDPRETPTQPMPEVHVPIGQLVAELRRLFWLVVALNAIAVLGIGWMVYRDGIVHAESRKHGRELQLEILNRLPAPVSQ